ncbi:DUF4123 domain-containing protein [Nereida sp. MMG025]|uniref:DUF4123 domain-containing protein n=1 Tax=Nereida sp. MMG025 TaxID=2909981 RepID=UPI001F17A1B6|nr:DUF4123 domain-containing protein [Nereida sp. MMG025]
MAEQHASSKKANTIGALLWGHMSSKTTLYALIDGQHCPELYGKLVQSGLNWCNLYQGATAAAHLHDAPYLIELQRNHEITQWLWQEGWGKGWGIYLTACQPDQFADFQHLIALRAHGHFIGSNGLEDAEKGRALLTLRKHFRRFTEVSIEGRKRAILFRFYDPNVLQTWLPTCTQEELIGFFRSELTFFVEGEHKTVHRFRVAQGTLIHQTTEL